MSTATLSALTEAYRLIAEAVELEKQARRLRERAKALMQTERAPIWTGQRVEPGSVRWEGV